MKIWNHNLIRINSNNRCFSNHRLLIPLLSIMEISNRFSCSRILISIIIIMELKEFLREMNVILKFRNRRVLVWGKWKTGKTFLICHIWAEETNYLTLVRSMNRANKETALAFNWIRRISLSLWMSHMNFHKW